MKRTMSEALQTSKLTDDALAFIAAGTAQSAVARTENTVELSRKEYPVEPAPPPSAGQEIGLRRPGPPAPHPAILLPTPAPGPVSMTFRLPPAIPAGLIRASADRKLRRMKPFSQQEIVAEALRAWLGNEGYLPWAGDEVQESTATQCSVNQKALRREE